MVDSGGFALSLRPDPGWSVHTVAECIAAIEADVFVNLDLPPSLRDDVQERQRKIRASMDNFRLLLDRFSLKQIMPVVHGRTRSEIELSLRLLARTTKTLKWIGLGGVVPLLQRRNLKESMNESFETFIALALSMIRDEFPISSIHVFGAGGTRTFPAIYALGGTSADSIGWRQAAGFGSIFLPLKSQRVVKWNNTNRPPRRRLNDCDIAELTKCACPICSRGCTIEAKLAALEAHFYNRSIHNAWIIANQMMFWPKGRARMISLVGEGMLGAQWAEAVNRARWSGA